MWTGNGWRRFALKFRLCCGNKQIKGDRLSPIKHRPILPDRQKALRLSGAPGTLFGMIRMERTGKGGDSLCWRFYPRRKTCARRGRTAFPTTPAFLPQVRQLAEQLKSLSAWQLETLLHTSPELALRAFVHYQEFDTAHPGWPALLSYRGLAYSALSPESFSEKDLAFAQQHVRILSALYGALRPLDGILPHRLEFQCGVRVDGKTCMPFGATGCTEACFPRACRW